MQKVIDAYGYEIGITVHLKSLYWKKCLFDVLPEHLRMWLLTCMCAWSFHCSTQMGISELAQFSGDKLKCFEYIHLHVAC